MYELHCADSIRLMDEFGEKTFDTLITDPPSGIGLRGWTWDSHTRHNPVSDLAHAILDLSAAHLQKWELGFLAFTVDWAQAAYRCLKPGGAGTVWSLPRTSDLTQFGLRLAGYEIVTTIEHLFGQGLPKGYNIEKGFERRRARLTETFLFDNPHFTEVPTWDAWQASPHRDSAQDDVVAELCMNAEQWKGWRTGLKPAHETWILCQRPREDTYCHNATKYGVGGLWVEGTRVAYQSDADQEAAKPHGHITWSASWLGSTQEAKEIGYAHWTNHDLAGRFPADVLLSHAPACTPDACAPHCPTSIINRQSGPAGAASPVARQRVVSEPLAYGQFEQTGDDGRTFYADAGGAARFFYQAKAAGSEKDAGLEDWYWQRDKQCSIGYRRVNRATWETLSPRQRKQGNIHPTVKPLSLLRYLARLTRTPTNGTILDPFAGTGSVVIAALLEGRNAVGIDKEEKYIEMARQRIEHWTA